MRTRQYFWQLISFRPSWYLLYVGLYVLFFCIDLVPGLLTRELLNSLTGDATLQLGVPALLALFVVLQLVRVVVWYRAIAAEITYKFFIAALLRKNMLRRVLQLPGSRALPVSSGEATSQFRGDVDTIVWSFTDAFTDLIGLSLFAVIAFTIMLRINAVITLAVFLPLVGVIVLANLASKRVETYRRANRAATAQVAGALGELFNAVQVIKVADAEEQVVRHFRKLNNERRRAALRDRLYNDLLSSVFARMGDLGTGVVLLLSAQAMRTGTFTIGDFALFVYFLGWVTSLAGVFGSSFAVSKQAGVSIDRMQGMMQGAPSPALVEHGPIYLDGTLPLVPLPMPSTDLALRSLEARQLSYHHPASGRGIEDINLSLQPGSLTVITGRVGAGKNNAAPGAAGIAPKGDRRNSLEWHAHRRSWQLLCAAA